jgi:hypothetical protein
MRDSAPTCRRIPRHPRTRLECVKCGKLSYGKAIGWQAHVAYLEEDDESPEVFFCSPFCSVIEFGAG